MSLLDLYYSVRPLIPRPLQILIRRYLAGRKRNRVADRWPILESAGTPPEGWKGWPDGKQFALLLTHDVETQNGHDKCRQLMDLEKSLGFHSSFNLVPERYNVSAELRAEMVSRGFEVGVHGLCHDGHLFRSRKTFEDRKPKINQYIRDWNASGFRSPSMRKNLNWIGELDVFYDCSTFDTDPFEPHPLGAGTIFPCRIERTAGLPYIELPYTLPQDSTLFIILGEKSIRIWKEKIDWIAERGGMALLNVHPDYMQFDSGTPRSDRYPATLYAEFMEYVRERFRGKYWNVLPREAARFCMSNYQRSVDPDQFLVRTTSPFSSHAMKPVVDRGVVQKKQCAGKVLMLDENHFPADIRVWHEATALRDNGYEVSVICLRRKSEAWREDVESIHVYRVPVMTVFKKVARYETCGLITRIGRTLKSTAGYFCEYFYFTGACLTLSVRVWLRHGFDVVHAHNPPDTLCVVGAFWKLFGRKFVFDHHDLSPELYRSRFGASEGAVCKLLILVEKLSLRLANVVIATNESYRAIQKERGKVPDNRIFTVRNGPDLRRVQPVEPSAELRGMGKTILAYLGAINPQDGLDYLLRALHVLAHERYREDFYCVIVGSGDSIDDLKDLSRKLKLEPFVRFAGFVPDAEVLAILSSADICVDPDPASPLNDVSTWIKIMEYMAMGKPIVSFALKETQVSAQDAALFVPPNDVAKLAAGIEALMDDPARRDAMGEFGRRRVERELQWSVVGQELLRAYDFLFGR